MPDCLYLDFETRSHDDIEEVGLDNYARSAEVLMLGWAINNKPVKVHFPHEDKWMPDVLYNALINPTITKIAWNAPFEKWILEYVCNISVPICQFRDPMILARSISLPGKLERVCEILKLDKDEAKKDGDKLIDLFCRPNGRGGQETLFGVEPDFWDEQSHPKEWQEFVDYCIRDVEVERLLWQKMLPLSFPEDQWQDWFLDQEINEFGMPVNIERAKKALRLAVRYKEESQVRMKKLTGLENPNSVSQLLPWLKERGYTWSSINKQYVDVELQNPQSSINPEAREVLTLRRKSSQSSYTKIEQLVKQVSPDGFLKHQFMFFGAARTGRWSAGGVQVMNMPRPTKQFKKTDPAHIYDLLDREAYDEIVKEFGSTLPFVSSLLRMLFEVSE